MEDDPPDDPVQFAPGALEAMEAMMAENPTVAGPLREMLANMRQAHIAWRQGRYPCFEDAMEAISGIRPERID